MSSIECETFYKNGGKTVFSKVLKTDPSKHDTLSHCWFNVGPPSTTLAQRWLNVSCGGGGGRERLWCEKYWIPETWRDTWWITSRILNRMNAVLLMLCSTFFVNLDVFLIFAFFVRSQTVIVSFLIFNETNRRPSLGQSFYCILCYLVFINYGPNWMINRIYLIIARRRRGPKAKSKTKCRRCS